MSKEILMNLASKEAETFKAGEAIIRKCSINTGKEGEEYRVSLNVAGFNHPVYISIDRFTMLNEDILHGVLRVEDASLFKGAILSWDHARVCYPGENYTGADGREFEVQEDSSEYIELWNELIDVDFSQLDRAEARTANAIASGRLTSQVVFDAKVEAVETKKVSLKAKAEEERKRLAEATKTKDNAKIGEK